LFDDYSATPRTTMSLSTRHADVGFFLQTYAHVLKNDDRDAAEQAASFLIGDDWASGSDDESR
jgi:hypothetical protein